MNREFVIFLPVVMPVIAGIVCWCIPESLRRIRNILAVLSTVALVWIAAVIYNSGDFSYGGPWFISTVNFSLETTVLNRFILIWVAVFSFLITLYVTEEMVSERSREFITYLLITAGLASGAILSSSFVALLFFWEALLITLYLFIVLGGRENSIRTALKGFILVGFCDFCLILGIAIYWKITGSFDFPTKPVQVQGIALFSFILMVIGATGKAGALPFHTWITDAAIDAPVSFMAFLPGALEKLLGIYFLTKICFNFFSIQPGCSASLGLMSLGALTIVVAVSMALIQKDIKRLLSYHAISQVGYMIVGIGSGVPAGVVGGLFHMLNNAIYKSALFLGAGSVEKSTKTTDLKSLGGLYDRMPVTGLCFIICAAAISGIWPLNGYVSKEMVIHGALETGYRIFAIACWIGAILTFASFLKASHSMFFGEKNQQLADVRENGPAVLLPMAILACLCIFFGLFNEIPLRAISDAAGVPARYDFSKHALDLFNPVSGITVLCLIIAFILHMHGWLKSGKKAYLASEVVHHLPAIRVLYDLAEKRIFDLYEQGLRFIKVLSLALYHGFDRSSDWLYERLIVVSGVKAIDSLRSIHRGYLAEYLGWFFAGVILVFVFVLIF